MACASLVRFRYFTRKKFAPIEPMRSVVTFRVAASCGHVLSTGTDSADSCHSFVLLLVELFVEPLSTGF